MAGPPIAKPRRTLPTRLLTPTTKNSSFTRVPASASYCRWWKARWTAFARATLASASPAATKSIPSVWKPCRGRVTASPARKEWKRACCSRKKNNSAQPWPLDLDHFSSTAAVAVVDFAAAVAAAFSSAHLSVDPADWAVAAAVAAAVVAAGPVAVAADPIAAYWGWSGQVAAAGSLQAAAKSLARLAGSGYFVRRRSCLLRAHPARRRRDCCWWAADSAISSARSAEHQARNAGNSSNR